MFTRRRFAISALLGVSLLVGACQADGAVQADAGADFSIRVGDFPTFYDCASEGEIQNYMWAVVEAPELMAGDVGKVIRETESSCSFTVDEAMNVQTVGTWVIELTVSDEAGTTSADMVAVEVML